ncbi:MAG: methyltransferase domain-containing protein [Candidatus Marinimicrobia bacterium]|jgi:2-polyprenyl-3-methyl-5-hydroxy-6-metoxy-1,4-benzoquinol methylase|nr:methyltransferase domain-containing protein [Candidatus Neomarinimicrobiota bacterium]
MDIREHNSFNSIEDEVDHWWIRTRFNYINEIMELKTNESLTIIEYGCGTCNNIYYLLNCSKYFPIIKSIIGVDPNLKNLKKPKWITGNNFLLKKSFSKENHADIILAMDVLEHIENDYSTLEEWVKTLKPGGLILITVPAFMHLWSNHDTFLGHYKRYKKSELKKIALAVGLQTVKVHYAFSFIYPIVYFFRKIIPIKMSNNGDLKKSSNIVNKILSLFGYLESKVGGSRFFGTSVIGLFKKV